MNHFVKILICLKPFICSRVECEKFDTAECIHQLGLDGPYVITPTPLNEKESGALKSDIGGRRTSGKSLSRVEQLGVQDMVKEMLKDKHLTLSDIGEAVYKKTGQRISKASLSRYYKHDKNKKV